MRTNQWWALQLILPCLCSAVILCLIGCRKQHCCRCYVLASMHANIQWKSIRFLTQYDTYLNDLWNNTGFLPPNRIWALLMLMLPLPFIAIQSNYICCASYDTWCFLYWVVTKRRPWGAWASLSPPSPAESASPTWTNHWRVILSERSKSLNFPSPIQYGYHEPQKSKIL